MPKITEGSNSGEMAVSSHEGSPRDSPSHHRRTSSRETSTPDRLINDGNSSFLTESVDGQPRFTMSSPSPLHTSSSREFPAKLSLPSPMKLQSTETLQTGANKLPMEWFGPMRATSTPMVTVAPVTGSPRRFRALSLKVTAQTGLSVPSTQSPLDEFEMRASAKSTPSPQGKSPVKDADMDRLRRASDLFLREAGKLRSLSVESATGQSAPSDSEHRRSKTTPMNTPQRKE
jgi:hypothetical protein